MKRITLAIILVGLTLIADLIVLWSIGVFDTSAFRWGPSETLLFFEIPINTYPRYMGLAVYTILNAIVMSRSLIIVSTWLIADIQNPLRRTIDMDPKFVYLVVFIWGLYLDQYGVVGVHLQFTQIDLWLCLWCTNMITTIVTVRGAMEGKMRVYDVVDADEVV